MLETLLLSATYITAVSQSISNFLVTPEASQKSTISGFVSLSSKVIYGIKTLFLFTKSDLKTVLIPVIVFAGLSQPNASPERLAASLFWTWAHLLQCVVSNQCINPAEDLRNKPWRPICSKRITMEHALILRWSLIPLCLLQSYALGVPWQGLSLSLACLLHNDLGLHSHWFSRTLCNAWAYASFNAGAVGVLFDTSRFLDTPIGFSIAVNALIILTTIHAQDFYDEIGDRLQDRQTLPIVWPEASRTIMLLMTLIWSFGLLRVTAINPLYATAFLGLGLLVGMRFYFQRDVDSDRLSYTYYNAWLTTAQVIHTPLVMQLLS